MVALAMQGHVGNVDVCRCGIKVLALLNDAGDDITVHVYIYIYI